MLLKKIYNKLLNIFAFRISEEEFQERMQSFDSYLESLDKNLLVKKMPSNSICKHLNTDIYYGKTMNYKDLLNEKN